MNKKLLLFVSVFVFSLTISVFLSSFQQGSKLDRYFRALSSYDFVPYSKGYTLEELIKIELREKYPSDRYEVTGGLEMASEAGYAIGEIDILVFDRHTGKVVVIGEAKVWRNLAKALIKAKSQLIKLKDAINSSGISSLYYVPDPKREFKMDIFKNTDIKYLTFGSKGAEKFGFDYEVDITPSETTELNNALIKNHYQDFKQTQAIKEYIGYVKKLGFPTKSDKNTFIACVRYENSRTYSQDKYKVLEDLSYFDENGTDLGHVKLVFADRKTNQVANVLNIVYGWNNLKNAAKVYNGYLFEFNKALQSGKIVNFKAKHPKNATLSPKDFGVFAIDSYGKKGAIKAGFTKELPLTQDDVFYIRMKAKGDI